MQFYSCLGYFKKNFDFMGDLKTLDMSFIENRSFTYLKKCILVMLVPYLTVIFEEG